MTSGVESPASVRQQVSAASPAPSRLSRIGRPALIVAVFAMLAGGGYYGWRTWFAAADPAGSILTAAATHDNLEDTVTATGTLQPKEFVDVGTQVSGQLKKLLVEIGDVVKKGQLLA